MTSSTLEQITVEDAGARVTGYRCLPWSDSTFKRHCDNVGMYFLGGTPVCRDHLQGFLDGQLAANCESSICPAEVITERIPPGEPGAMTWVDDQPICEADPRLQGAVLKQAAMIQPGDTAFFSYNRDGELRCAWVLVNEVKPTTETHIAFFGRVADDLSLSRRAEYPGYAPVVVVPYSPEGEA